MTHTALLTHADIADVGDEIDLLRRERAQLMRDLTELEGALKAIP